MTTKVKITNESDPTSLDHHIIEVIGADGSKNIVTPGNFVETHIWQGTKITIIEIEERRSNWTAGSGGYGAIPSQIHD